MRKFLSFVVAILLFVFGNSYAANFYGVTSLTGGGSGALDALDITGATDPNVDNLADGDVAVRASISGTTVTYTQYVFDADGTDAESSPNIIRPDDYATQGVWRLHIIDESLIDPDIARDSELPTALADLSDDATHRTLTDVEKAALQFGSGIASGYTISINADPEKIDIAAGTGYIVDLTDPLSPILVPTSFDGATAVVLTYRTTNNITYLAVNSDEEVVQQTTPFTASQRRELMIIGAAIHSNLSTVNAVNNLPDVALNVTAQLNDLLDSLKEFNNSGNLFSANGANLSINKSAGTVFKKGSNFGTDPSNPHVITTGALVAPDTIRYRLRDGTEYSNTAFVDPDYYDLAGVRTAVGNNQWSIQHITLFTSNLVRIQYGQATYSSKAAAIQAISTEPFVAEANVSTNGLARCILIVQQGATDLSDTAEAAFFNLGKFGSTNEVASGVGTTTLQQAYENGTEPEITTNTTRGAITIKRGSAADTDLVIEIKNGADSTTFSVDGNGKITGSLSATAANPSSADGAALGTTSLEWSDLYLADGGVIYGQNDQSNTITSGAAGWTFGLFPITPSAAPDADYEVANKKYVDDNIPANPQPLIETPTNFTAFDETPSVSGHYVFKTANAATPTTITNIDGMTAGQSFIILVGDASTTIDFSQANIVGNAEVSKLMGSGDILYCYSEDGTVATCVIDSASRSYTNLLVGTQFKIPSSNSDPSSAAGYFKHDTTISGFTNGGLVYYNGAAIKQLIEMTTATASACTDDQVVAYDADNDLWYCKDDSTGAGSLGSNLSSTTNDITSDNNQISLVANSEDLDLDFTSNTVTVTTDTGVDTFDFGVLGVVANSFSTGGSATPSFTLKDTDDAAGTGSINANSSGGANDVVLTVGVEDSTGESTPYVEIDGVSETIDLLKPVVMTSQLITDNSPATIDDADAADNDFAKFTANGLEGRSYSEVRTDLGIDTAANLETSLSLGAFASDLLGYADAASVFSGVKQAATDSATGVVELATTAETTTGTDTGRSVTPDGLSGSVYGQKEIGWTVVDSDTATAVADGLQAAVVPASMNGMNLIDVTCSVADLNSASGGTTTVVLRRVRAGTPQDMTSTGVTIDYDAYTASDETVDTSYDDVATGDLIFVDINAVTTGAAQLGLSCTAVFQTP
jgi:hypothetical protein